MGCGFVFESRLGLCVVRLIGFVCVWMGARLVMVLAVPFV